MDRPYPREADRALRVCRTPIDASMQRRWQNALARLEQIVGACRRRRVEVALVIVPSEFQLNPVLLETLCRRGGYEPDDLDLELPQRRLAEFAGSQHISCIDLLPHLRLCEVSPYRRATRRWNAAGTTIAMQTLAGWLEHRCAAAPPSARIVSRR